MTNQIKEQSKLPKSASYFVEIAAFIFTTLFVFIGTVSQIITNYNRGSTEGLSPFFFVLSFLVWFLWSWFGFLEKKWFMFVAQGFGAIFTFFILMQIFLGWPLK